MAPTEREKKMAQVLKKMREETVSHQPKAFKPVVRQYVGIPEEYNAWLHELERDKRSGKLKLVPRREFFKNAEICRVPEFVHRQNLDMLYTGLQMHLNDGKVEPFIRLLISKDLKPSAATASKA